MALFRESVPPTSVGPSRIGGPRVDLGARVRRLVNLCVTMATALVLAAPMWLGPAAPWTLRQIGVAESHSCACGMQKGKCGCLECAAEEAQEREAKTRHPYAALKSSCGSEDVPFPGPASLPAVVLASPVALPAPAEQRLTPAFDFQEDASRARGSPPVPPPRAFVIAG